MNNFSLFMGCVALMGLVIGEVMWGQIWVAITYLIVGILIAIYIFRVKTLPFHLRVLKFVIFITGLAVGDLFFTFVL